MRKQYAEYVRNVWKYQRERKLFTRKFTGQKYVDFEQRYLPMQSMKCEQSSNASQLLSPRQSLKLPRIVVV